MLGTSIWKSQLGLRCINWKSLSQGTCWQSRSQNVDHFKERLASRLTQYQGLASGPIAIFQHSRSPHYHKRPSSSLTVCGQRQFPSASLLSLRNGPNHTGIVDTVVNQGTLLNSVQVSGLLHIVFVGRDFSLFWKLWEGASYVLLPEIKWSEASRDRPMMASMQSDGGTIVD